VDDDRLSHDAVLQAIGERLSKSRVQHSIGVADTASRMADIYGADQKNVRLAGLLHDWDKDLSVEELVRKAMLSGLTIPLNPEKLLHAHTGALSVADEFALLEQEVIQAIDRHTLAAANMSDLDMIIYVADMIEPSRVFSDGAFALQVEGLRALVGVDSLQIVFMSALQLSLSYLVEKREFIHILSIEAMEDMLRKCTQTEHEVFLLATATLRQARQYSVMQA